VRQREIQQICRAARKAGASGVTVNVGGASVVIAFPADGKPGGDMSPPANEWDTDDEDKA
jgi:hypothetical protein